MNGRFPTHLVSVVSERAGISELSAALMNTARKDWMTLETLDTEMPLTDDFAQLPLPAFATSALSRLRRRARGGSRRSLCLQNQDWTPPAPGRPPRPGRHQPSGQRSKRPPLPPHRVPHPKGHAAFEDITLHRQLSVLPP